MKDIDFKIGNTVRYGKLEGKLLAVGLIICKIDLDAYSFVYPDRAPNHKVVETVEIEGIPISATNLKRFLGFLPWNTGVSLSLMCWHPTEQRTRYDIDYIVEGNYIQIKNRYVGDSKLQKLPHIRFIHQIENLYYSLTGVWPRASQCEH